MLEFEEGCEFAVGCYSISCVNLVARAELMIYKCREES